MDDLDPCVAYYEQALKLDSKVATQSIGMPSLEEVKEEKKEKDELTRKQEETKKERKIHKKQKVSKSKKKKKGQTKEQSKETSLWIPVALAGLCAFGSGILLYKYFQREDKS